MSCFTHSTSKGTKQVPQRKKVWKKLVGAVRSKLGCADHHRRFETLRHSTNQLEQRNYHHREVHHYYHHFHCSCQNYPKLPNVSSTSRICMDDSFTMHQVGSKSSEGGRGVVDDDDDDDNPHHDHEEDGFTTRTSSSSTTLVQLSGVDAEAEKFIARFHQILSLERQRSNEEFFAMLNREFLRPS